MDFIQTVNNRLVKVTRKKVMTDSLTVAHNFGKRHDNVIQKIEETMKMDDSMLLNFKATYYTDDRGNQHKKYIMDRKSFAILAMGFTGKKAFKWKLKFIDAFEVMEEILTRQNNLEWQEYRQTGKTKRHELTDSINRVVQLAELQGSKNANKYYTSFTKLIYGQVFGVKKIPDNFRNMLDEQSLQKLTLIETHTALWIKEAAHGGIDYHQPYKAVKRKLPLLLDIMGGMSLDADLQHNKRK